MFFRLSSLIDSIKKNLRNTENGFSLSMRSIIYTAIRFHFRGKQMYYVSSEYTHTKANSFLYSLSTRFLVVRLAHSGRYFSVCYVRCSRAIGVIIIIASSLCLFIVFELYVCIIGIESVERPFQPVYKHISALFRFYYVRCVIQHIVRPNLALEIPNQA